MLAGVELHVNSQTNAPMAALIFDIFNALVTVAGFGFALGIGAAAWSSASTGALPAGYQRTGLLTALLQFATIPGLFVESGFLAAGGPMPIIAFGAIGAWYIAVAIRFLRTDPRRGTGHGRLTAAQPGQAGANT